MRKMWKDEEVKNLIGLIYEGKSINEISDIMSINTNTIYSRVSLLNRKSNKNIIDKLKENNKIYEDSFDEYQWNEEDDMTLIELRKQGMSYKDISKDFIKTSICQLQGRAIYLKIEPYHKKRWTEEEEIKVIDMYMNNESFENMAIKLNRSQKSIEMKLINLGQKKKIYWNKEDDKALLFLYGKYKNLSQISEILNKTLKDVESRLDYLGVLEDKNKCKRCGEDEAIKKGKYKGYCRACIEDIKCKEMIENKVNEEKKNDENLISRYIKNNRDTLQFCTECNCKKDIYEDYYYSVSKSKDGYKYVNKECKICSKKRNYDKKIKNLKNKGHR